MMKSQIRDTRRVLDDQVQVAAKKLKLQQSAPPVVSRTQLSLQKKMDAAAARAVKKAAKAADKGLKASKRTAKGSMQGAATSAVVAVVGNSTSDSSTAKERPPPTTSRPKRITSRPTSYVENLEEVERYIYNHTFRLSFVLIHCVYRPPEKRPKSTTANVRGPTTPSVVVAPSKRGRGRPRKNPAQ